MVQTLGYAAQDPKSTLAPFRFERREPAPSEILFDVLYCGVCHSDIHQVRNEWGGSTYPMVPGHEVVGRVSKVGSSVSRYKIGDLVGVGCFLDSCRECQSCKEGEEQYCDGHLVMTYNGTEKDLKTPTYGGYSTTMVVDEKYALSIPKNLELSGVAPLLCAGITTYSPLRKWKVGKGHKLAVVGLGGLGHMAVKFGAAFGAHVTVLSTSPSKAEDAKRLGAHDFICTKDEKQFEAAKQRFDFILDAVSAQHDVNSYLELLKRDGQLILVGAPSEPVPVSAFSLILRRRSFAGSMIGGIRETQEMLDYCSKHNIVCDVEVIPMEKINEAYERTLKGDVRYRFVIDLRSLGQ